MDQFEVGEFEASLKRLCSGDLGLVDSLNAMQLAMQATVSQVKFIVSNSHIVHCPVQVLRMKTFLCPKTQLLIARLSRLLRL